MMVSVCNEWTTFCILHVQHAGRATDLVVGQTVDYDELDAPSRTVVVDDKVLTGVDVFVVVVPADLRCRRSRHDA